MPIEIPADATDAELQDIHCGLLDAIDEIRVIHRWGPSTIYAVECSVVTAAYVLGKTTKGDTRYRLTAGVDYANPVPETVFGIEILAAKVWRPILDNSITVEEVVEISKRAGDYLGEHHKFIDILLRIDHMLIGRFLERS